ncbi:GNAT family N-acetyltransferase [Acidovorax sp.]|uniref:GNAT family N-acetyltransferase n=1 Tax=Acidovorax sp. TaxID=1872122 RepID=UPI00391D1035
MAEEAHIIARVLASPLDVDASAWNALLAQQSHPTPFLRHEYLAALHESGSATPRTGWVPRFMTLWEAQGDAEVLVAACPLYLKNHSYGEYVFDWAWANAYEQHGVPYYPKAVVAVPFTPVPGTRLLARDDATRALLVQAVCQLCEQQDVSSVHVLFASEDDVQTSSQQGLMLRHTVQFHWKNVAPTLGTDVSSLPPEGALAALGRPGGGSMAPTLGTDVSSLPPEGALAALGRPGGGSMAPTLGTEVSSLPPEGALAALGRPGGGSVAPTLGTDVCSLPPAGEGAQAPPSPGALAALGRSAGGAARYTSFDHFLASLTQDKRKKIRQERRKVADAGVRFRWSRGADISAADWDFFYRCYERTYLEHGNPPYLTRNFFARMAAHMPEAWLLFVAEREGQPIASSLIAISALSSSASGQNDQNLVAYGRYWGALERVDCLHFEACYYQPLQWCIEHGALRFEGGAQGEHKMSRALLPVQSSSAHWLAHPAFAEAVERFLQREGAGVADYLESLNQRLPIKPSL